MMAGEDGLTALICNAGVGGPFVPSEALPLASFDAQLQVNLVGTLRTLHHFVPLLRSSKSKIILMGSMSGSITVPFSLGYSISKKGLEVMADSLRYEFALSGRNISVSLIKPGPVLTPIWSRLFESSQKVLQEDQLKGKLTLYREALIQVEAFARLSLSSAIPCKAVDDLVIEVLRSDDPRPRYFPGGWKDRLSIFVQQVLPDDLWDKLLIYIIKSSSSRS
jgi:NAD(P)-dependent dehydrogenase (short-subunit alcohol dehydrogenase family)